MMAHEPECPWPEDEGPNDCLWCLAISAAYQRGREDAANAVGAIESWDCVACGGLDDVRSDLIAAARGDGADLDGTQVWHEGGIIEQMYDEANKEEQ